MYKIYTLLIPQNKENWNKIFYALILSIIGSITLFTNNYLGPEDPDKYIKMFTHSSEYNIRGVLTELRPTTALIFKILVWLHFEDISSYYPLILLLFKFQIIMCGYLIINYLKIKISLYQEVLSLAIISLYPYFLEPILYRNLTAYFSISFIYLWVIILIILLYEAKTWKHKILPICILIFCLASYQPLLNLCIFLSLIILWINIYNKNDVKSSIYKWLNVIISLIIGTIIYFIIAILITKVYPGIKETHKAQYHTNFKEWFNFLSDSVFVNIARAIWQGKGTYNLISRLSLLTFIIGFISLCFNKKNKILLFIIFLIILLSNFSIYFILKTSLLLPRTLTSFAFFSFFVLVVSLNFYKTKIKIIKIYNIALFILFFSYSIIHYKAIQDNTITTQRDYSLATCILNDIYKIENYKTKEFFFINNELNNNIIENIPKHNSFTGSHLYAFEHDQQFPVSYLIYVSGLNFIIGKNSKVYTKYPYEKFKNYKVRYNIIVDNNMIIVFL